MKNLKKCFGLGVGRKSGLSFATFAICAIILLAVPLQISCSDSGDDNGDSTVGATLEGGRMIQILVKQSQTLSRLPWQRALRIKMLTSL